MDDRYFGYNLLTFRQTRAVRGRVWTEAAERDYYVGHAPAGGLVPSIATLITVLGFAFMMIGLLWGHDVLASTY